ncbi:MAG: alpha-L-fucosidase, partial [Cytophagia bacterium]|nr:alpha-L-fucosidase [Cytophagia bacterium]
THAVAPYKVGKVALTQKADGTTYFLYMADEDEKTMPSQIHFKSLKPQANAKVRLLGGRNLSWKEEDDGFVVNIPAKWQKTPPADYVWVFEVSKLN